MIERLEDQWIGERLIAAGVITREQRDAVLEVQSDPLNQMRRFGHIAVDEGYCKQEEVESIGGFLGEVMIQIGLITEEQRQEVLDMQQNMREGGLYVPSYGDLVLRKGFCTKEELERVLIQQREHFAHQSNEPTPLQSVPETTTAISDGSEEDGRF